MSRFAMNWGGSGKIRDTLGEVDPGKIRGNQSTPPDSALLDYHLWMTLNQVDVCHRYWSSDFIPGKGHGKIVLLHGTPGVGRTTAAECVAELARSPLLTITCGDLGSDPLVVEQELKRWLRLGMLWNAVLLFDEEDVFLESRGNDLHRNSLVSVFLRALEYFPGLLFLTTNRGGTFDEAILSRVHVILHFP
jgi:SpoVK/Ycf46/Vps4 family AAA+-type ATPase